MKKQLTTTSFTPLGLVLTILTAIALVALFSCVTEAQNTFPSSGAAGIGTASPNASSVLDLTSTTKGMLVPRMTKTQRDAITLPATGLLIYQTNSTPGFYYYSGSAWTPISAKGANATLSNLKASTAVNVDLLPATSNSVSLGGNTATWKDLFLNGKIYFGAAPTISTSGTYNFFGGAWAGNAISSGVDNTGVGYYSLGATTSGSYNAANGGSTLFNNTTGNGNTASGFGALYSNTSGYGNAAYGIKSMLSNTSGSQNTAIGDSALYHNTTSDISTAVGYGALFSNTDGQQNTATGARALYQNTTGGQNSAFGVNALGSNIIGGSNTAMGFNSLSYGSGSYNTSIGSMTLGLNSTGSFNTAIGAAALYGNNGSGNTAVGTFALQDVDGNYNTGMGYNCLYFGLGNGNTASGVYSMFQTTGDYNTSTGYSTLYDNTTGYDNTAIGSGSLENNTIGYHNTAMGTGSGVTNVTGNQNISVGSYSGPTTANLSNTTAVGYGASTTASNQVRIGNNANTSIGGFTNWTNVSDGRIKKNIQQNVPGLEFINKLQPVTYNLDLDAADKIIQKPEMKDQDGKVIRPSEEELNARKVKEQVVYTGFIAQDVEAAAKDLSYDFSGVDAAKNDHDLYGLRYSEFVVPLVKAVQELSAENEELKNRLSKIESLLNANDETTSPVNEDQKVSTVVNNSFSLGQNIPNPFQGSTVIPYSLPENYSSAQLVIVNNRGMTVKSIELKAISGSVQFQTGELTSGIYQYSLVVDGKVVATKQMEFFN